MAARIPFSLSRKDRAELQKLISGSFGSLRVYRRARALLSIDAGEPYEAACFASDLSLSAVQSVVNRYR